MQTLTLFPYDIARYNSFLEQIKGNHLMVTEKIERFPEVFLHVASDTDYNKSDLVIPTDIFSLYRDIIVSQSGRGLIEEVTEMLKRYKLTISVAESCTGGLISHLLTQVSGSSNYFILGAITYSNYAKTKILGVPNDILKKFGAVHEKTAKLMATGIKNKLNTDIGLATTGIAGPTGGTKEKPVGTICISLIFRNNLIAKRYHMDFGNREKNKTFFAYLALNLLRYELIKQSNSL